MAELVPTLLSANLMQASLDQEIQQCLAVSSFSAGNFQWNLTAHLCNLWVCSRELGHIWVMLTMVKMSGTQLSRAYPLLPMITNGSWNK